MKSGNINFLEPSGPPEACNGTDLPLQEKVRVNADAVKMYREVVEWTRNRRKVTSFTLRPADQLPAHPGLETTSVFPEIVPFVRHCWKIGYTNDTILRRMRIACWITKATNTHSKSLIFIALFTATMVTATMVTRTSLHIPFVCTLPVLLTQTSIANRVGKRTFFFTQNRLICLPFFGEN